MSKVYWALAVALLTAQTASAGTTKLIEPDAYAPAISADGRFVLYSHAGSSYLYVIGNGQKIPIAGVGGVGISANGRYVAGITKSPLVPNDTNDMFDTYVLDRDRNIFTRVSVSSAGRQANRDSSFQTAISANGRFVAFKSVAFNLVPGDTNGISDVFLHDLQTGTTERISVDSAERQWSKPVLHIAMSASGRFIAMSTFAPPTGGVGIFIRDQQLGTTARLPIAFNKRVLIDIMEPSISADGRFVAFEATDQRRRHVFVFDRQTSTMEQVDLSTAGAVANRHSRNPEISPDGRFVVFQSSASNLVPGDSDGPIFVRDRKEKNTRRVSFRLWPGVFGDYSPLISAGGRFVIINAYEVDEDTRDLYIHDRAGR